MPRSTSASARALGKAALERPRRRGGGRDGGLHAVFDRQNVPGGPLPHPRAFSRVSSAPDDYALVVISPGIWTRSKGMSDVSIVADCATNPHHPTNTERIDPFGDQIRTTRPFATHSRPGHVREGAATAAPPERAKQCPSESVLAAVDRTGERARPPASRSPKVPVN
jgi:hypothetical protein